MFNLYFKISVSIFIEPINWFCSGIIASQFKMKKKNMIRSKYMIAIQCQFSEIQYQIKSCV